MARSVRREAPGEASHEADPARARSARSARAHPQARSNPRGCDRGGPDSRRWACARCAWPGGEVRGHPTSTRAAMNTRARDLVVVLHGLLGMLPGASGLGFHLGTAWAYMQIAASTDLVVHT